MDPLSPLPGTPHRFRRLAALGDNRVGDVSTLPFTVKILLENLLRQQASGLAGDADVRALAAWPAVPPDDAQLPFIPARVLLQDFTGVPAVVDLAAMRAAMQRAGKDPGTIDPLVQVDVVIDHSVQVDAYGTPDAYQRNLDAEFARNGERYAVFRWAQQAFRNFRVVPPGMGICHQVNLERLSTLVHVKDGIASYDTLVGADSHTTMVNGLGVLGWGVGGIEAEAAMLGQPMYLPWPVVIGVRLTGALKTGVTATDFVLTLTELFRKHGVVDKFVEFCGSGLSSLSVPDRATLSNMCPDYGATAALFPIDERSLEYMEQTGRGDLVPLVRAYATAQGLFRTDATPTPTFNELIEFDLGMVEPSLAGPKRPQDRVGLAGVRASFEKAAGAPKASGAVATASPVAIQDGAVVLAAITSCTNTSNPSVMIAAGLVAKKAVERGLTVPATVKPSLAPGSRVVTRYLDDAGLTPFLDRLGFNLVGYGCTTCIAEGTPVLQGDGTAVAIETLS
ncbi:MAG: aconitate hydratase AcnA, partial [Chloroflexi bacterium]|nr:aconitate hydratase AcnA [Chloroflexota bacterium]